MACDLTMGERPSVRAPCPPPDTPHGCCCYHRVKSISLCRLHHQSMFSQTKGLRGTRSRGCWLESLERETRAEAAAADANGWLRRRTPFINRPLLLADPGSSSPGGLRRGGKGGLGEREGGGSSSSCCRAVGSGSGVGPDHVGPSHHRSTSSIGRRGSRPGRRGSGTVIDRSRGTASRRRRRARGHGLLLRWAVTVVRGCASCLREQPSEQRKGEPCTIRRRGRSGSLSFNGLERKK